MVSIVGNDSGNDGIPVSGTLSAGRDEDVDMSQFRKSSEDVIESSLLTVLCYLA